MGANERICLNGLAVQPIVSLEERWNTLLDPAWLEDLDNTSFLTRCRQGDVSRTELRTFVVQQFFYSRHFTRFLCALLSNMGNESDRMELTENLLEEIGFDEHAGVPHSQIYREMMVRMGVDPEFEKVLPSTKFLVDAMYDCCRNSNPLVGLAAMCLGAEAIVPHVYSQIVRGFQSQGEPIENLEFFRIHIECDDGHAITMRNIIDREIGRDPFQMTLLKLTALRLLQARTRFFEGVSGAASEQKIVLDGVHPTARLMEVRHDSFQLQGL
jgi:pyrroloquinoline-quinone synthase